MADNNQPPQGGQQIEVKAEDKVLRGVYSNMMQVGHTKEEFALDFMNIFPPHGVLVSRIMLSPSHMKRIVAALQENLKRYEEQFGKVPESTAPEHNFGFRTN